VDLDTEVKLAIYRAAAETGAIPTLRTVAARVGAGRDEVKDAFRRLRTRRVLFLEPDGETIRMAPPFSGIPTQHVAAVDGIKYHANCAWDALAIPAALHRPGLVWSECADTREPLRLQVDLDGPEPSTWLFHCLVPAAKWWDDLVYT
jgi:Alkylmercury lyase